MEDLAELLFALASVDRLTLLSTIAKERLRLTQLASRLSASTQETSRHLSRLEEAKLIQREPDGCFIPTSLGRSFVALLPSLKVLTQHREYFLSHDLSTLPLEFLERIGELEQCEFRHGIGGVLNHTADVFRGAKRFVWLSSDNVMDLNILGRREVNQNVPLRIVIPAEAVRGVSSEMSRAGFGEKVELKIVDGVCAGLALNEKRAGVTLPGPGGKLDFNSGFGGDDPKFQKWCADLFIFHWNKAKSG